MAFLEERMEKLKTPRELKDEGSGEIRDLQQAMDIIEAARQEVYSKKNDAAWQKLYHAGRYLADRISSETNKLIEDPEK